MEAILAAVLGLFPTDDLSRAEVKPAVDEPVVVLMIGHQTCDFDAGQVRFRDLSKPQAEKIYLKDGILCVVKEDRSEL